MELAPVPHRVSPRGERRWLVLAVVVGVPAVLLVLLPAVLGLQRYVVTDPVMDGSVGRGALAMARPTPVDDLRTGDVVTFVAPSGAHRGDRVTRRVIAVSDDVVTTRSDAAGADPWHLSADTTYARVWVSLPWLGLPFVVGGGWLLLAAAALAALVLALLAGRSHRAESARRTVTTRVSRPQLPVA